jgi:hypothetical protein
VHFELLAHLRNAAAHLGGGIRFEVAGEGGNEDAKRRHTLACPAPPTDRPLNGMQAHMMLSGSFDHAYMDESSTGAAS